MPIRKQDGERGGTRDAAEAVAITVFAQLANEPEELQRFLALSGIEPETVRDAARQPGFLVGVLDYVLGGQRTLAGIEGSTGLSARTISEARQHLAGESVGGSL